MFCSRQIVFPNHPSCGICLRCCILNSMKRDDYQHSLSSSSSSLSTLIIILIISIVNTDCHPHHHDHIILPRRCQTDSNTDFVCQPSDWCWPSIWIILFLNIRIPSEIEVAPRYKMFVHFLLCLYYSNRLNSSMYVYLYLLGKVIIHSCQNAFGMGWWASEQKVDWVKGTPSKTT